YPDTSVSVIIIIRLPQIPIRVHRNLVGITKIMSQYFQLTPVRVTTKSHPLSERFSLVVDRNSIFVFNDISILVHQTIAHVTKIEIQFSVWTKSERMNAVVMLFSSDRLKQNFFFIRFIVAICIRKNQYL